MAGAGTKLVGKRFGRLVVLRATEERRNGYIMWECQCDCGNTTLVRGFHLTSGRIVSCGCQIKEVYERRKGNLIGQKFHRLTVIADTGERSHRAIVWECKCDCGNTAYVTTQMLTSGDVKSCGCLRSNLSSGRAKKLSQYKKIKVGTIEE